MKKPRGCSRSSAKWRDIPLDIIFAKIVLNLLGLFLCVAVLVVLFGGAFLIFTYQRYRLIFQNQFLLVPGCLAVASAVLLILAAALAMWAPVKDSRRGLAILMYLLLVLICLEVSSIVLTHIYSAEVESQLENRMGTFFHKYNRSDPNHWDSVSVDAVHKQLKCCGISNYTDWMMFPNHHQIRHDFAPESCCKEIYLDCHGDLSQPEKLFKDGCHKKLEARLHFVKQYMTWSCVVVIWLEILVAVINGKIMKGQSPQDYKIIDSANFS